MGIMHAKFQASNFIGVGEEWGDRGKRDITPQPYTKFLNSPLCFGKNKLFFGYWIIQDNCIFGPETFYKYKTIV